MSQGSSQPPPASSSSGSNQRRHQSSSASSSPWETLGKLAVATTFVVGAYVVYSWATADGDTPGRRSDGSRSRVRTTTTAGEYANKATDGRNGDDPNQGDVPQWGEMEDLSEEPTLESAVDESERSRRRCEMEASVEQAKSALLRQRRFGSVLRNEALQNSGLIEHYFHLGLDSNSPELERFSHVKFLLIVRSKQDVMQCLHRLEDEFPCFFTRASFDPFEPIGDDSRFFLTQVGPVAVVSCGIGAPTMSILLQEVTKLLVDSGAFRADESNDAFEYDTSYVDYILVGTALGLGAGPKLKSDVGSSGSSLVRRSSLGRLDSSEPRGLGLHSRQRSEPAMSSSMRANNKNPRRRATSIDVSVDYTEEKTDVPSVRSEGLIPVFVPSECFSEILKNRRPMMVCGDRKERRMRFSHTLQKALRNSFKRRESMQPKTGKVLSVTHLDECLALKTSTVSNQSSNVRDDYMDHCMKQRVKCVDSGESWYLAMFGEKLHLTSASVLSVTRDLVVSSSKKSAHLKSVTVSRREGIEASMDVVVRYIYERLFSAHALEQQQKMLRRKQRLNDQGFGTSAASSMTPGFDEYDGGYSESSISRDTMTVGRRRSSFDRRRQAQSPYDNGRLARADAAPYSARESRREQNNFDRFDEVAAPAPAYSARQGRDDVDLKDDGTGMEGEMLLDEGDLPAPMVRSKSVS